MTTSTIATLLQLMGTLLLGVQNNPNASQAAMQQAITTGSRAVQLVVQTEAMPTIGFPIPKNSTIWPNIEDLRNAPYLDSNGHYTPDGTGVSLVETDTSFGDMNLDGFDDAAVVVQTTDNAGNTSFALAAMLNQGGIMFNIGDLPLGKNVQVFSHHVVQGGSLVMDMQIDNLPRATYQYQLVGTQLMKI